MREVECTAQYCNASCPGTLIPIPPFWAMIETPHVAIFCQTALSPFLLNVLLNSDVEGFGQEKMVGELKEAKLAESRLHASLSFF